MPDAPDAEPPRLTFELVTLFPELFEGLVSSTVIGKAITGIFSVFPDLAFETRRAYLREDLVVQEWTAKGTHEGTMTRSGIEVPPTGRKVDYNGMDVIPIRDGLVARKDVYSDSVTLLRPLGLTSI